MATHIFSRFSRFLGAFALAAVLAGPVDVHAQECSRINAACNAASPCCTNLICVRGECKSGILLLEQVGDVEYIPTDANPGLGVFGYYFNLLYPWVVGMAAATAVLMAVIGGIQIIQAGSDSGAVGNGKNRLLIALGGLLLILASATLMNALNPTFYR